MTFLRAPHPWRALLALVTALVAVAASAAPADAAITVRASACDNGGIVYGYSQVGVTIPKPTGTVAGDLMVATVSGSLAMTAPSGWTQLTDIGNSTTYYKVATASEGASYAWTGGFSYTWDASGGMTSFIGADTADPIDVTSSSSGSGSSVALPTATATTGRYRYTAVTTTSNGPTHTFSAGLTERCDTKYDVSSTGTADEALAGAGAIPARTDTLSGSSSWAAHTAILNAAESLTASFPGAYALGSWTPPTTVTSVEQIVSVTSTASWGVKVSADRASGRMAEWTGAAYTAVQLANPLTWRLSTLGGVAQGTSFAALNGTPTLVTGSRPAGTSVAVGVTYRQPVSFADVTLTAGRQYRLQLTYTATQGF